MRALKSQGEEKKKSQWAPTDTLTVIWINTFRSSEMDFYTVNIQLFAKTLLGQLGSPEYLI